MGKPRGAVSFSCEFFKVFLANFSAHQLSLPPAFVAQLNGRIPNNATLKDHTGKKWRIRLEKSEADLIITDGWQEFAIYHSLVDADFLTFKYDGNSQFDVDLYGKNGLKKGKKAPANSMSIIHVKEEKETDAMKICSEPTYGCKRNYFEMDSKRVESSGSSGRSKSCKAIATKFGEQKLAKALLYVAPKGPYFVKVMNRARSSFYSVHVPNRLLMAHNIQLKAEMKLRDENGWLWPIRLTTKDRRRKVLTTGWRDFCRMKKVVVGDNCVFEFILTKQNICSVMEVQVVRAGGKSENKKGGELVQPVSTGFVADK